MGPQFQFDLVRPGAALYGVNPTPEADNPMQPVVELKARIVQIRNVERGETVGYGGTWTARRPTRLAIVAAGYADGYFRAASANDGTRGAEVVVAGKRCPIAGRVSMDLMAVDVTDLDKNAARRGHMVTLIGEGITVDELAHHFGTIGYEVLTSLGRRFARVYKGGEAKVEPPRLAVEAPVRRAQEPAPDTGDTAARCHRRPRPPTRHEGRDLQHQQRQPAPAQSAALAARGKARRRGAAGVEGSRHRVSDRRDREGRLRRGVARPEDLERRCHPRPQCRAGPDPRSPCPATPPIARRATSKPPCAASS